MEKLATDIYTFEKLIRNGFTYVDKTDRLLPLVDMSIGAQFFIARPLGPEATDLILYAHHQWDGSGYKKRKGGISLLFSHFSPHPIFAKSCEDFANACEQTLAR